MNPAMPNLFKTFKSTLTTLGVGISVAACASTPSNVPSTIVIDGSSTVYPIVRAAVEAFQKTATNSAEITVNFSGTGGGFRKFCTGKTDISNASRPISQDEMELCNKNDISYIELPIAFDALTIVVNPQNTWLESITTAELKKIWEPAAEKRLTRWNQVRPSFPNQPLNLYGPGEDSGTYDYFTETIVGQEAKIGYRNASRLDYLKSENDETLVQGVQQDPYALGYFGFTYYEANPKSLKAVAVDNGKGAVIPSREAVEKSQYQPLARPLLIYVNLATAQNNPVLRDFVEFFLASAPAIVAEVGDIPLPEEGYHLARVTFSKGETGSVFDGEAAFDLTIGDMLRKQAKF